MACPPGYAMSTDTLPIAHRVWAEPQQSSKRKRKSRAKVPKNRTSTPRSPSASRAIAVTKPSSVLFLDTETTVDTTQSLMFGVWRYCIEDDSGLRCIDEGVFYADDLDVTDPSGMEILRQYVKSHEASTTTRRSLRLMSRGEFVNKVFFPAA